MAYNPAEHVLISTSLGVSNATPTDARSMYYDNVNLKYRDYQNEAEVLAYLDLAKYRTGHFFIFIHIGGSLSAGVWTGGLTQIWCFKNGTLDSNLVRIDPPEIISEVFLVDGPTITWDYSDGAYAVVTLTDNRILNITNTGIPCSGVLQVYQDAVGSRLLTLPGTVPTGQALSTTPLATDILRFVRNTGGIWWNITNY